MSNITFRFILFIILNTQIAYSQQSDFVISGHSSLLIKFSGQYPKNPELSTPYVGNALSLEKPSRFDSVNDSTFRLNFDTFGPSTIYFRIDNRYFSTVILPGRCDELVVKYNPNTEFTVQYRGPFKEIFDQSSSIPKLIKDIFKYKFVDSSKMQNYSLQQLRIIDMQFIEGGATKLTEEFESPVFKLFAKKLTANIVRDIYFSKAKIRKDKVNLLHRMIMPDDADTSSLISGSYSLLLNKLVNDSLFNMPDLRKDSPFEYRQFLITKFSNIIPSARNLLYDMVIAYAYINQIEKGESLTNKQEEELKNYFINRDLSNYILRQNEAFKENLSLGNEHHFFLPFKKEENIQLEKLISRYKGKVVLVDFWATWCGPCIAAHNDMTDIKLKYKDMDVVFVYITDETSERSQWNAYVNNLVGEHYYLFKKQNENIMGNYKINTIPTYILFDRTGSQVGDVSVGYPGRMSMIDWIEAGLRK